MSGPILAKFSTLAQTTSYGKPTDYSYVK